MPTNTLYEQNFPHMAPVWTRIFNFVAERAEGSYIYTDDGRKLLDFTCGIGVTNTGHCHPKVVEAIREQAGLFIHAQANLVIHKPMLQLIEELRTIVAAFDRFILFRQLRCRGRGERRSRSRGLRQAGRM